MNAISFVEFGFLYQKCSNQRRILKFLIEKPKPYGLGHFHAIYHYRIIIATIYFRARITVTAQNLSLENFPTCAKAI